MITNQPTIIVRKITPRPCDGIPDKNPDGDWVECMKFLVRQKLVSPSFDVNIQTKIVTRRMIADAKKHPVRTVINFAVFASIPMNWPRIIRRLNRAVRPPMVQPKDNWDTFSDHSS